MWNKPALCEIPMSSLCFMVAMICLFMSFNINDRVDSGIISGRHWKANTLPWLGILLAIHTVLYMHPTYSIWLYRSSKFDESCESDQHEQKNRNRKMLRFHISTSFNTANPNKIWVSQKMLFDDYLRVNGCCIAYKCETDMRGQIEKQLLVNWCYNDGELML